MPYIDDYVYDSGLDVLNADTDELHVCSQEPTNYAEVATYSLGVKSAPTVSVPTDRAAGGREVDVSAISDGVVSTPGEADSYALIDTVNSRLLIANQLSIAKNITTGTPFTLTAFKIEFPDPV